MKLLARVGGMNKNVVLDFHATNGLTMRQMHAAKIILVELHMARAAFHTIELEHGASTYCLSFENVKKFAETVSDEQTLTFSQLRAKPDILRARIYAPGKMDCTRGFTLRDISSRPVPKAPFREYTYPIEVTIATRLFTGIVSDCVKNGAEFIEFSVRDNELVCTSLSDTSAATSATDGTWDMTVAVDAVRLTAGVPVSTQCFSAAYLQIITAMATHSTSSMTLRFGSETQPLHCVINVAAPDGDETHVARIDVGLFGRQL
jgi:hypothetical protein